MICCRPDVDFLVNGKPSLAGRQNFIFGVITTSTTAAPSTTTTTTAASNTTSALASPFRYNEEADGSYILRDLNVSAGWPMFSHSMGCRPTYSARWLCSASPCSATWSAPPTWGHTSSSSESLWCIVTCVICQWLVRAYLIFMVNQIVAIYSLGKIKTCFCIQ